MAEITGLTTDEQKELAAKNKEGAEGVWLMWMC